MCEACHDSTHALAKSREPNDGIKFVALQGDATYLKKCSVCHGLDSPGGKTKAHAPVE
jgi:mono/diheme cytochrome c family protein